MKALPIVERELRVASRRLKTYVRRGIIALAAVVFGGWLVWTLASLRVLGVGSAQIFQQITQIVFVFCLFAGVTSADCLSEEKREGTIGLLFLTDLKGYDIVSGKLLATSLQTVYGLLVVFPILSLVIPMGGVQGWQFFQLTLTLLNTLFLSISASLFVSSVSRNQKRAANAAALLLIFLSVGFVALSYKLRNRGFIELAELCGFVSPWTSLESIFGTGTTFRFWWSLLTTHMIAWGFLVLACLILPHAWRDKPEGPTGIAWRDRLKGWMLGHPATRVPFRRSLLNKNPFYWLAARERLRPATTWSFIGVVLVCMIGAWWYFYPYFELFAACTMTSIMLHTFLKLEFAATAARRLAEERHTGTIELILSTPLKVREIVRGQWLALRRQYLFPVLAVIGLDVAMIALLWVATPALFGQTGDEFFTWFEYVLLVVAGMTIMLFLDGAALGSMAMWYGLKARLPSHAAGPAVLFVLIVPWVIFISGFTSTAILRPAWLNEMRFAYLFCGWFALGFVTDVSAILWSRRKLHREFRIVATERFQPPGARRFWPRPLFDELRGPLPDLSIPAPKSGN